MPTPIRAVATIAAKDLRQQLRSGTLLVFGIVLPLGLAFLFNAIIPDSQDGFQITFAAADDDGGPAARTFIDDVLPQVADEGTFDIVAADSATHATELVQQGTAAAAFVVPAGFSADIEAGHTAQLHIIGDANASVGAYIARQIATSYAEQLRGVQLAVAVSSVGTTVADPQALAAHAAAFDTPLSLQPDQLAADRQLDSHTYYAAGMAVFFLFFVAMLSVSSIFEERGNQTMARLLAAPLSRPAVLLGKLVAGVAVGLAAMVVLVAGSTLLFGAEWGAPLGVAVLVVALVLAATAIMALIATMTRSSEQATNWMSVIAVVLGLFGGSFVPLAQLGGLAAASYITPHRWFLQGLSDLASGDLSVVVAPTAALLGFAAVAFTVTFLRIGKVVRP